MPDAPVMVRHTHLETFIVATLMAMKMPRAPAEITAGLMVRTDLRGVDSHGIGMLPRYVERWREGYLVLDAGKCLGRYPAACSCRSAARASSAGTRATASP